MPTKSTAQQAMSPVTSKQLKETLVKNREALLKKDVESVQKFLELQQKVHAPLREFYKNMYPKKGGVLKRYQDEVKKLLGAGDVPAVRGRMQLYRDPGMPGSFEPLLQPTDADLPPVKGQKLVKIFQLMPPFAHSDFSDPILLGNVLTYDSKDKMYPFKPNPNRLTGRMEFKTEIEGTGFVFATQSIGHDFYADSDGLTEIEPILSPAHDPVYHGLTGEIAVIVQKRLRVEKIYPVASLEVDTKRGLVSHYTGPENTVFDSDDYAPKHLYISFNRKKGEQYRIWVDILFMVNLFEGDYVIFRYWNTLIALTYRIWA